MSKTVVETTLGALIVALTDEAVRVTHEGKITYNMVAYLLADLLRHQSGCFRAKNFAAIKAMTRLSDALSWQSPTREA